MRSERGLEEAVRRPDAGRGGGRGGAEEEGEAGMRPRAVALAGMAAVSGGVCVVVPRRGAGGSELGLSAVSWGASGLVRPSVELLGGDWPGVGRSWSVGGPLGWGAGCVELNLARADPPPLGSSLRPNAGMAGG